MTRARPFQPGVRGPRRRCAVNIAQRAVLVSVAGVVMLVTAMGCASSGGRDGRAALESRAQREAASLRVTPIDAPPPPMLASLVAMREDRESPRRTLSDVLDEARQRPPERSPTTTPVSEEDRLAAVKLYAVGREKLLRGGAGEAAMALRQVVRLDPTAAEAWLSLADAELALGARVEAMASLRRAVDLGVESARSRELLGRDAMGRGEYESSVREFARAMVVLDDQSDPALRYLVPVQLGQALMGLGEGRAAREALERGIALPELFTQPTLYRNDIVALYRRRAEVHRLIGDVSCQLGEFDRALAAYGMVRTLAESDVVGLAPREVYALVRLGRPHTAAAQLVRQIVDHGGRVSTEEVSLIAWLVEHTDVGESLDAALASLGQVEGGAPPSALTRLALARAEVQPSARAAELLIEHLRTSEWDADVMAAVVRIMRDEPLHARARAAARIAATSSLAPGDVADALLTMEPDAAAIPNLLGDRDVELALKAHLLVNLGRDDEAISGVESLARRESLTAAVSTAQVAATLGRWTIVDGAIDRLTRAMPSVERDVSLAIALMAAQRFDEALAAIRERVNTVDQIASSRDRIAVLSIASEAAIAANNPSFAKFMATAWLATDAHSERAHARWLVAMDRDPGRQSSEVEEAMRSLRRAAPDGRLIRTIQARELLARGLRVQAERVLVETAAQYPHDVALLELLSSAWDDMIEAGDADAASRAEGWIRERLEAVPQSPLLVSMLARVLAASGRGDEAVDVLTDRLAVSPVPQLARLREAVLRGSLDQSEVAQRLMRERLSGARQGVEEVIERTDLHVRDGDHAAAALALRSGLPRGVTLTPAQQSVLTFVLDRASAGVGADSRSPNMTALRSDGDRREDVIDMFESFVAAGGAMPPTLHASRIVLLASRESDDERPIIAATEAACEEHPSLATPMVQGGLRALLDLGEEDRALALLRAVGTRAPAADVFATWLQLVVQRGDADDGRALVYAAHTAALSADVLRLLREMAPVSTAEASGEMAYIIGVLMYGDGREADAMEMYRVALEVYPRHGWAANNLGYHLIDQVSPTPAHLREAEHLLLMAQRELPTESSVLDSVGWLRYKQGIMLTREQPSGDGEIEGAVSLLRRASAMAQAEPNPTILDHLGDALWASGDQLGAVEAWERAETEATIAFERIRRTPGTLRMREELQSLMTSARAKRAAVDAGESPAIASYVQGP